MKKATIAMTKTGKWLLVFGVIFSQLSFPLSVLADETINTENNNQEITTTNVETEEPVITINGVETATHTITGNITEVEIILEYQGETEIKKIDFSNKLYGTYQYNFTSVEKKVTINYPGNNIELLTQYENATNDLSKKLIYSGENCIISGFGKDLITVEDITTNYYNIEAFEEKYSAKVEVSNGNQALSADNTIINGYQLTITDKQTELINTSPITSYTINRIGDIVPEFGIIDNNDQETILNDILKGNEVTVNNDINEDSQLNILDVTHPMFIENVTTGEETPALTNTLTKDTDNILIGDEVEIKLFINGFDKKSLYGIEGILTYNSDVLELISAQADETTVSLGHLNLDNNKFAYVLNGFNNAESAIITLKFKALSVGNSEVTISNIIESYGEAFKLENDTVTTSVTVLDYGKGGDVEENNNNEVESTVKTEDESTVTTIQNTLKPVVLSSDYYIKNLEIIGYEIDFYMHTYEYSIKVGNDVSSLELDVLLNSDNSIYYVEGNENFKVGENIVNIVVKAENGSTKTYTIKVEKEEKVKKATKIDEEETEEKNTSKTIIIILIVLVIIGLIYVIFKDDEEDKKEIKKSVQPEKIKKTKKGKK